MLSRSNGPDGIGPLWRALDLSPLYRPPKMIDECQHLTRLREKTPDQADEVSLFYNPASGAHRIVVRELHRRPGTPWFSPDRLAKRVLTTVTVGDVADFFGVAPADARRLLDLAREEGCAQGPSVVPTA